MSRRFVLLLLVALLPVSVVYGQDRVCDAEDCTVDRNYGLPASALPVDLVPPVSLLGGPDGLLADRMYQRLAGPAQILDAPAGALIRGIDAGFTFVTTQGVQIDYTQINPGEWVLSSHLTPIYPSSFAGVYLDEPLEYPMAWLMRNIVPSDIPGAEPPEDGVPLMRYQRVSLFAVEWVDGWRWYQIGPDQWIEQTNVAKVIPVERPADVDTERWVSIDLYEQVVIAYEGNTPVFASLVSSGLEDWPTNEGLFHVYHRSERAPMSGANAQPDYYDLEEVPWTMYFDGDIALHGAYWHDGFGYRHSHGCVNLSITDAWWLYQWSAPEFDFSVPNDTGMAVYVYSSGTYR